MPHNLTPKPPSASAFEKNLPFSSDPELRDQYINYFGDLRFGKILEELDMAAGRIAYEHADGITKNLTIVTAACDRIDLLGPLVSNQDLCIRGQVNYVGTSSMEIGLRLGSKNGESFVLVAEAFFIMVARKGYGAAPVNPLVPETEEDQQRWQDAQRRREQRRADSGSDFRKQAPTAEESDLIHQLFLGTSAGKIDGIAMHTTQRQSTFLMHPQERNIHHKIFGGHIMRLSFELGWNIAHLFGKRRPLFLCVDHFDFFKPVEIGAIVGLTGLVTFTGRTSFIVEVVVEVIHPATGVRETTNISYFTFVAVDEQRMPFPVPKILPNSYLESLKYLDGARRYKRGKLLRKALKE